MITTTNPETTKSPPRTELQVITARHLACGWLALVFFLSVGIVLEALHGVKAGPYLDVSNHTRRLMWTLAHAHGTALALVQIVFALTLSHVPFWDGRHRALAGACLQGAAILIPAGFFLGGAMLHAGDPGLGIVLVPLGAMLLLMAGGLTARAVWVHQTNSTVAGSKKLTKGR